MVRRTLDIAKETVFVPPQVTVWVPNTELHVHGFAVNGAPLVE
jgi:hypothetical protein